LVACGQLGRPNANTYDFNGTATAFVTPDGQAIVYSHCEQRGSGTCSSATVRRWTPAGTALIAEGAWASTMSADGRTVLYWEASNSWAPVRWDIENGPAPLPIDAKHLSADGSVAVGYTLAFSEPARWSAATGTTLLGHLPGGGSQTLVFGISADASVVVGQDKIGLDYAPFRWTSAGMVNLGGLPTASSIWGSGETVSANGSVVAGYTQAASESVIFRWTQATGMAEIAPLFSGFDVADSALRPELSDDGSVLAGTTSPNRSQGRAFRWTEGTGVVLLDPDGPSFVRALSADGSVVLGSGYTGSGLGIAAQAHVPFMWDAAHGKRELESLLAASSVDLSGWTFGEPVALSKNGKIVVGLGTCNGTRALYRAAFPE